MPLVVLFKRVANILRAAETRPAVSSADLPDPTEAALLAALERARREAAPLCAARDYDRVLAALLSMARRSTPSSTR